MRMAIENGVQISTWPMMTAKLDSGSPSRISTTSSDTATMMSGSTSGSMMKPITGPLPGKRYLLPAREAKMPNTVASTAVEQAMTSECSTAARNCSDSPSSANHLVVKPFSGKAMIEESLKANSGSRMIGA